MTGLFNKFSVQALLKLIFGVFFIIIGLIEKENYIVLVV
jgi:hypothetical protein